MNLVINLMSGVALAGLAEGMALADRAGLQQKDILEVLGLTGLACPMMVEKGKAILEGSFPPNHPLQHMQKDLKLSLNMGGQLEQPLPLTATANEVFKHEDPSAPEGALLAKARGIFEQLKRCVE